jgi:diguanylate cyclase (GGDEF)-like protein
MRGRGSFVAALACLSLAAAAGARGTGVPSHYAVDSWQAEHGLPQATVQAIVQTRDGYLWVGTQDGLARFDGVRFEVFDRSNTPAMTDATVLSLLETKDGDLYAGTWDGLLRWRGGRLDAVPVALPSPLVRALAERDGTLWIGSDAGLRCFDPASGKACDVPEPLLERSIRWMTADPDGTIWIGTVTGLVRVPPGPRPTAVVLGEAEGLPSDAVRALTRDSAGALWVATPAGLFRCLPGEQRFTPVLGLPLRDVQTLGADRRGNVWIGSYGEGLVRFSGGVFDSLADTVPGVRVRAVTVDREENVWIGTTVAGLVRLRDAPFYTYTQKDGLESEEVRATLVDRKGAVWFGEAGGGLARLADGRVTHYAFEDRLKGAVIRAIAEDERGELWLGTQLGIARLAGDLIAPPSDAALAKAPHATAMTRGRLGLYMAVRDRIFLVAKDGAVSSFAAPDDEIRALHEDRRGALWGTTARAGLFRIDASGVKRWTRAEGLPTDRLQSIYEDDGGDLWLGSKSGLIRMSNGRLSVFGMKDGLLEPVVTGIVGDRDGNLWLSGNRGIYRIPRADLASPPGARRVRVLVFGRSDGLRSIEGVGSIQPAAARDPQGRLYFPMVRDFPMVRGLAMVDPTRVVVGRRPPPVRIERVLADGEEVRDGQSLAPGLRVLDVRYTALTLSAPEKVRFRVRLDGFDRSWVDVGGDRSARYTGLGPGRYTLRVAAASEAGTFEPDEASLRFAVKPRLVETRWFQGAALILFVVAGPLFHRTRLRRERTRKRELEAVVQRRTEELRSANERLEALSIVDGLTGVANRRRLDETLDVEWRRGMRTGTPVAFLIVDVDQFKAYNDSLGHQKGDEVLRAVARALASAHIRAGELVARYGGEEFGIVIAGASPESLGATAERARRVVEALAIRHPRSDAGPFVTISVGASVAAPRARSGPEELVAAADRALYRAKEAGRNRAEIEVPSMRAEDAAAG